MKRFSPVLLSPDPDAEGGGGSPPPAASAVLDSDAKEGDAKEIVRLKRLAAEQDEEIKKRDKALKDRETRVAELEDENRTLKTPKPAPVPPAAEPEKAAAVKKGFLSGLGDWSYYGNK